MISSITTILMRYLAAITLVAGCGFACNAARAAIVTVDLESNMAATWRSYSPLSNNASSTTFAVGRAKVGSTYTTHRGMMQFDLSSIDVDQILSANLFYFLDNGAPNALHMDTYLHRIDNDNWTEASGGLPTNFSFGSLGTPLAGSFPGGGTMWDITKSWPLDWISQDLRVGVGGWNPANDATDDLLSLVLKFPSTTNGEQQASGAKGVLNFRSDEYVDATNSDPLGHSYHPFLRLTINAPDVVPEPASIAIWSLIVLGVVSTRVASRRRAMNKRN